MRERRQLPKTGLAKASFVAKTRPEDRSGEDAHRLEDTWAPKTFPEDRSGEDKHRLEDTWAREDTSKTGLAKTRIVAKRRGRAKTLPEDGSGEARFVAKTRVVAKTRIAPKTRGRAKTCGRHIERRQSQRREAACLELQGRSCCCSKLYASTCQVLFMMAQLLGLIFPRSVHTRPRFKALAPPPAPRTRARTHRVHNNFGNVSSQIQHLRGVAPCGVPTWRCSLMCGAVCPRGVRKPCRVAGCRVATWRHRPMSGSQLASPDVASKRGTTRRQGASWRRQMWSQNVGVTGPRSVREPAGGVKTWRHLHTWRHGTRWRRQMSRQNVASGSQVASPDVASTASRVYRARWRHWRQTRVHAIGLTWRQNVASKRGVTCSRGVREPRGVAGRGVRRHRPTWGRRMWRQKAQASRHVSSKMCLQSSGKTKYEPGL